MGARFGFALAGVLAVAGCGGPAVTRAPSVPPCATRTPAAHPADTLTVVLFDAVDLSHAPWGRNREERFVFSHLYETLLTVDCRGQLQPGLAKRWVEASDGWLIEMRDDARFWDQTPVTVYDAADVIKRAIAQGIAIKSVDVIDEHSMIIHGYSDRPDLKLLTLQMFAVTKTSIDGVAPMGSGYWMLDEDVPVAEAVVIHPSGEMETPVVRFVQGNVSDARDILDGTADAMITDDPAAIEYARTKKNVSLAPLAWDRAYVLISGTRAQALAQGRTVKNLPASFCDALAQDAVRVDARGASRLVVDLDAACNKRLGERYLGADSWVGRLVYNRADAAARGLAERIVSLAAMDTATNDGARALSAAVPGLEGGVRAHGMPAHDLEASLGGDLGYIVPLSRYSDPPCPSRGFIARVPSESIIPLIETRAHFVAISDRIGFIDEHNETVRIMGPSVVKVR